MKKLALLFFALQITTAAAAATAALPAYSIGYNPKSDAFADGRNAIQLATETQRKILIEVGGDWCVWCHKLDQFLHSNPDLQRQLHDTFVMLKVSSESREYFPFFKNSAVSCDHNILPL